MAARSLQMAGEGSAPSSYSTHGSHGDRNKPSMGCWRVRLQDGALYVCKTARLGALTFGACGIRQGARRMLLPACDTSMRTRPSA